ncbi:MAG: VWA domain-containing protein, partial [Anaerolineaceae bacterium]|nr:VWA domain-containing protein [Anaerolineaceae bacterium]
VSYGIVSVYRPPKILFVSAQAADDFTGSLRQNGLEVDVAAPADLSSNLSGLDAYQVLFINNVLQSSFTAKQLTTIRQFAREKGGGVIFSGGQNGFTLGGYKNSIIEPMLPVKLEPPNRQQRSPVIFQLLLDNSGSMTPSSMTPDQVMPLDLAKEAGIRAIEMLDTKDWLGVLAFSDAAEWKMELRPLGDGIALRSAMDAIGSIGPDSTTNMEGGLKEALRALKAVPASEIQQRYLLLLTDGQSTDGDPASFKALAQEAAQNGIILSTIGLGVYVDQVLLADIAKEGGGRFYAAADAQDLPRIMMNESRAARSENIQSGLTSLKPGESGHPVLSGLSGERLAQVTGYVALQSKAGDPTAGGAAEDILVSSSFSDPILSAWQYGLGRVVTWTSDLGQVWSQPWPNPNDESYFWTQVVRYALPNPALGEAQVEISSSGARTTIRASIQDQAYTPLNLLQVHFT